MARARANLTVGGLIDLVEIREGDALQTLSVDLPETIDLMLLDGAKALYPEILAWSRTAQAALSSSPTTPITAPTLGARALACEGYMSTPFAEDVELSMWIG